MTPTPSNSTTPRDIPSRYRLVNKHDTHACMEANATGDWVAYDTCARIVSQLTTANETIKALTKEKDCWLFNAQELQKQVNSSEPERANLKETIKMLTELAEGMAKNSDAFKEQVIDLLHQIEQMAKLYPVIHNNSALVNLVFKTHLFLACDSMFNEALTAYTQFKDGQKKG